jgi:hypothetical protein
MLIILPILICGVLGAGIGYFYRFKVQPRRVATVLVAVAVFVVVEITSGTLSSKYALGENLAERSCRRLSFFICFQRRSGPSS